MRRLLILLSILAFAAAGAGVAAVAKKIQHFRPELTAPESAKPAKEMFGAKAEPTHGSPHAIGGYANGCLAGGVQLPITGPGWQVMRLSRNRNWGHPVLLHFIEHYAETAKAAGWPGLLIGDMAQPRGGPMVNGHSSHQIGLDVDIWLTPMPNHELSKEERETLSASNLVSPDGKGVDPTLWTPLVRGMVRAAATDPEVDRIFVNAAIKKQLCEEAGSDRAWLHKVRPWYKHNDHEHIRLRCPPGEPDCKGQPPVPTEEACGHELDYWFTEPVLHPPPPTGPGKELTLAQLPPACRQVLKAP
jgi:penicillin-insensitive murein DD-endopeptidase